MQTALHYPHRRNFIDQHLNGSTHIKNLQKHRGLPAAGAPSRGSGQPSQNRGQGHGPSDQDPATAGEPSSGIDLAAEECPGIPCQGYLVKPGLTDAKLTPLIDAFELWASFTDLKNFQYLNQDADVNYKYSLDLNTGVYTIRHHSCEAAAGQVLQENLPALCWRCADLGNNRMILRSVQKFYFKHTAARLLSALFFDPDFHEALVAEVKQSPMYEVKQALLDELLGFSAVGLQGYVRAQFMSLAPSRWSKPLKDFVAAVVQPCLKIQACSWNGKVADPACSVRILAQKLHSGALSTVQDVNLKLACHVASGALSQHPLVQGILVAAIEQSRRATRGVHSMKGHRLSDLELSMIAEAGVTLSMAASNLQLAHHFGISFAVPRLPLQNLHAFNLPEAFLSITSKETLLQNTLLIRNQVTPPRQDTQPSHAQRRNLVLAFDKTYLLKSPDVLVLRVGRCYVGTAFDLKSLDSTAESQATGKGYLLLQTAAAADNEDQDDKEASSASSTQTPSCDASSLDYAVEVLECLVWHPQVKSLPRFSLSSIPLSQECSGEDMLRLVGLALAGCPAVKCVVFDNASNHNLVKSMLLGQSTGLSAASLRSMPFWGELSYEQLPQTCLPRFPFRKPVLHGEAILGLNGPAHIQKNFCGQCRSPARTITFGRFFCDFAATLDLCMPPGPYQGRASIL